MVKSRSNMEIKKSESRNLSLAQAVERLKTIIELIQSNEGENDEETLANALAAAHNNLALSTDDRVALWDYLVGPDGESGLAGVHAQRGERSLATAKRIRSFVKADKSRTVNNILSLGVTEFRGEESIIKVQNNPESLELDFVTRTRAFSNTLSMETFEEFKIPSKYRVRAEVWILDTEKLKADIQAGETFPWARTSKKKRIVVK